MARLQSAKADLKRAGTIPGVGEMPGATARMVAAAQAMRPPVRGQEARLRKPRPGQRGLAGEGGDRPDWLAAQFLPEVRRFRSHLSMAIAAEGPSPFRMTRVRREQTRIQPPTLRPFAQEALTETWPWSTIGRVVSFASGVPFLAGTGTLIGRSTAIIASHLLPWGQPWTMTFTPGYRDGLSSTGAANVLSARGWPKFPGGNPDGYDIAVIQLDQPLGNAAGFMGYQSFDDWDDYTDRTWISVGYPAVGGTSDGHRPIVDFDIEIEDLDGDDGFEIETDYGRTFGGGWSGGPLWGLIGSGGLIGGDPRVIGVKSGYEIDGWDPVRSVFAGGLTMAELAAWGRANWG